MSMSNVAIVGIVPEPRVSKCGKSKEPQTFAKEFAPLKDRVSSLEDSAVRPLEHYFVLSQHVGMMEDGLHAMEDNVAAAMATFRYQLE